MFVLVVVRVDDKIVGERGRGAVGVLGGGPEYAGVMREDVQQTELVIGCFHPAYISERSLTCSQRFEPLLEPTVRLMQGFFFCLLWIVLCSC